MPRPRCEYNIDFCFPCRRFRPEGEQSRKVVTITPEEAEALRLKDVKEFDQTQAAERMGISQSTFQRILTMARRKVSLALIEGKAIEIQDQ